MSTQVMEKPNATQLQAQADAKVIQLNAAIKTPVQDKIKNYDASELAIYLNSQLTGKSCGKAFKQSVGETNFTEVDRKAIQEARKMHRLTLQAGEAKAALIHEIKSPAWKMVGFRENQKGDRRGMRFHNPTIQTA